MTSLRLRQRARRAQVTLLFSCSLAATAVLGSSGCSTTLYAPQVVARGELTLRYNEGFEMWAGGARVARGLSYRGLEQYVRCVPEAREHAHRATSASMAAIALSAL